MSIAFIALMIPIAVVAIISYTVIRLVESSRAAPSGATMAAYDERLVRLERSVEELREMVYDAVIDTNDAQRYAADEPIRARVDA